MIENLYKEMMNGKKLKNEIEEIIMSLDEIKRNQMIDIVYEYYIEYKIKENKENFEIILNVLSKYDYYKEKLLDYLEEKKPIDFLYEKDISLVRYLEIDNKKEFLSIIMRLMCMDFFILNYNKFDYTEEEKNKLYFICNNIKYKNTSIEHMERIKEKTGIIATFLKMDIYNNFNREKFDFFVNNFKLIKEQDKCQVITGIFLAPIRYDINKLNNNLYLEFFKENQEILSKFDNHLKKYEKDNFIGYAEKLILEKELKNF